MAQVEGKSETPDLVESAAQSANEITPIHNPLADSSSASAPVCVNESNPGSETDDVFAIESPIEHWVVLRATPSSHPMLAPMLALVALVLAIALCYSLTHFEECFWGLIAVVVEILIIAGLVKYQRRACRVTVKLSKIRFEASSKLLFGISNSFVSPWEKLLMIRIQHDVPDLIRRWAKAQESDNLVFYFPNFVALINLTALSVCQREALFKAVARYVPPKCIAPEALTFMAETFSGSDGSMNDFTEIWMGEYKRKFQLSNHALLSPGSTVANRYSILMPLSNRANLSTYLAEDKSGKRLVLKELVESTEYDASMRAKIAEQFMREASFLSSLNHPRICKIYDSFVENERGYIAMEHIPGHNFREYIRVHGAMPASEVIEIALQLAEILRYLHSQEPPVIHRDISPENLIYSAAQKQLHLIDFGAANTYATNRTATLVGKQSYMAPEQFRGKPQPASDVYGLGATLCFLLSRVEPEPLAAAVPPELASTELGKIIASCTQFESSQRANIEELLSSLRALRPTSES